MWSSAKECYKDLVINYVDSRVHPEARWVLKVWQVVFVSYLMWQETNGIGGGVFVDNYGLGKTVSILAVILFRAL